MKLYENKPSRIGVKFIYEFLAAKPYEKIISAHGHRNFSLVMEPVRGLMQMVLKSENDGVKFEYKDLEFKIEHIRRLRAWYRAGAPVEFVHIFPKDNKLMVAKPFRQERLIEINRLEFAGMQE